MSSGLQAHDLGFFATLAGSTSLSAASREMGVTTAAVSKHLTQLERRLGVSLINRSTRRMSLTPEGEALASEARRILRDIDALDERLTQSREHPQGLLRVNATLGFGRAHIAPLISRFVRQYPKVDVQLQLSVNPPALTEDAFDVCIRFGEPPDARVIARPIAANRRLLCAAPEYLAARGVPRTPKELSKHNCIGIRQGSDAYNLWRLTRATHPALDGSHPPARSPTEAIKTGGNLTTNDGEIAVSWALDGHGIVMRAQWDIARYLESGRLIHVLPDYHTPGADIYAVYPQRYQSSARVHVFVDFIATCLGQASGA
ncbi:MAG: LysR family transcriptional regulator [Burkholderiaceae bacterium]